MRIVRLSASLLVAAIFPPAVGAELRTGFGDRVENEATADTASAPALTSLRYRQDTAAGTLALEVSFANPLVDPRASSSLRATKLEVSLGSAYDTGVCLNEFEGVTVSLGDDAAAPTLSSGFKGDFAPIAGERAFDAERKVLTLTFQSGVIGRRTWVCADANVKRSTRVVGDSFLIGFMLDGFTPEEADIPQAARWFLQNQRTAMDVASCKRSGTGEARCTLRTYRLRGGGIARLRGTAMAMSRGSARYPAVRWLPYFRGKVTWSRCPAFISRSRRGRRCSVPVRWTSGRLDNALRRAAGRRIT